MQTKRHIVAISGASGTFYALRVLKHLSTLDCQTICIISDAAKTVYTAEEKSPDLIGDIEKIFEASLQKLKIYSDKEISAPCASGSFRFDSMLILPCSMNTLGKTAHSIADNLIVRTADVALKERRRLVVVPRETPLALTHLRNMCALSEAGAIIMPACPAFYMGKRDANAVADFIAARALSCMGIEQNIIGEWK